MTPQEAIEAAELMEAEAAYRRQLGREMYAAGYAAAEADMDAAVEPDRPGGCPQPAPCRAGGEALGSWRPGSVRPAPAG